MSHLTTHVLDTSTGKPAEGIRVILEQRTGDGWKSIANGMTDPDGRIGQLLTEGSVLPPGNYRLDFDTGSYFRMQGRKSFYPKVLVEFEITDTSHYHVPLLLSPFGYSTYRGS